MKAYVIATGEIVNIIRNSAFDKDVFYDSNGQKYNREELSFDFKEKSYSKDDDYWTRLEHQYAGMAMQALLSSDSMMGILSRRNNGTMEEEVVREAFDYAHALVEKYKKKEK